MGKTTLYKHSYLRISAMTAALAISTMTTLAFASDDLEARSKASAAKASAATTIGRFVVTPDSARFIAAESPAPHAE